jgi:hypothetical protein
MNTGWGPDLSHLSDRDLLEKVRLLARGEQTMSARLIAHLTEMETRRLYLSQGCRSLYVYCTEILRFSEYEAVLREQVARECRKYPLILEMLARGDVHLTNVRLLIPHLTAENHRELLELARGKSKRELEILLAARRPEPDVPFSARKLPKQGTRASARQPTDHSFDGKGKNVDPVADHESLAKESESVETPESATETANASETSGEGSAAPRAKMSPLSAERYRITFTASADTYDKLRRLQALLSHQIPDRDVAKILDRAVDRLLSEVERKKLAATKQPRRARPTASGSRHIPAAVKRAVWERDGARCAFVGESGHRCSETHFLQFHHVDPHGVGGPPTLSNVELRCADHNRYEAEMFYGPWIADRDLDPRRGGDYPVRETG